MLLKTATASLLQGLRYRTCRWFAAADTEPTKDEIQALTGSQTERLVLRAMIGAAQADGHIDDAEMEKFLGRMHDDDVTEEERRAAREEVQRPVDVEGLGAQVSRPEVAMEVYLGALMAVDIDRHISYRTAETRAQRSPARYPAPKTAKSRVA